MPVAIFCLQHIFSAGFGGDSSSIRLWFVYLLIAVVFGLVAAIAAIYYRSDARHSVELDSMRLAMQALSETGKKSDRLTPAYPGPTKYTQENKQKHS